MNPKILEEGGCIPANNEAASLDEAVVSTKVERWTFMTLMAFIGSWAVYSAATSSGSLSRRSRFDATFFSTDEEFVALLGAHQSRKEGRRHPEKIITFINLQNKKDVERLCRVLHKLAVPGTVQIQFNSVLFFEDICENRWSTFHAEVERAALYAFSKAKKKKEEAEVKSDEGSGISGVGDVVVESTQHCVVVYRSLMQIRHPAATGRGKDDGWLELDWLELEEGWKRSHFQHLNGYSYREQHAVGFTMDGERAQVHRTVAEGILTLPRDASGSATKHSVQADSTEWLKQFLRSACSLTSLCFGEESVRLPSACADTSLSDTNDGTPSRHQGLELTASLLFARVFATLLYARPHHSSRLPLGPSHFSLAARIRGRVARWWRGICEGRWLVSITSRGSSISGQFRIVVSVPSTTPGEAVEKLIVAIKHFFTEYTSQCFPGAPPFSEEQCFWRNDEAARWVAYETSSSDSGSVRRESCVLEVMDAALLFIGYVSHLLCRIDDAHLHILLVVSTISPSSHSEASGGPSPSCFSSPTGRTAQVQGVLDALPHLTLLQRFPERGSHTKYLWTMRIAPIATNDGMDGEHGINSAVY